MKKILSNIYTLAALLMAGAAFSACSSSEDAIEQPQQPATGKYTMTIKASKGNNATTRALTLSDKMLTATWATSEHVYVKKGSTWANGSLVPDADAATANLSGELSGVTIAATDELTLQFPKSGDFSYAGQKGTLSDIAQNFDYATADVTVASVTNGNINVSGTTTFTNHQAIVKFIFVDKADGTTKLSPTALTVSDGTSNISTLTDIPDGTYSDPNNGAGVLFVAIPGFSGKTITLTATIGGTVYTYTRPSTSFTNGQYYEITVKMEKAYVNLSALTSNYTAQNGDVLKGTLGSAYAITIADGATVTLGGVTVGDASSSHAGIVCGGAATIILAEGTTNSVTGGNTNAGIQADGNGKTLTINGSGSLTANGGKNNSFGGAGIGSNGNQNTCGNIVIEGGNIMAAGGPGAAGIGAGSNSNCGNISISGGTITATGGLYAAGIGGSAGNSSTVGACGYISITGGTIDATGGNSSAGIGGGFWCGNITITSGVIRVTSTAGSSAPNSIGGGGGSGTHCGTVTIGSTVGAISKSPFTYPVTGHVLTSAVVGDIICSDGLAYAATDKDYLPSGVTAVAMVAYMGSASDCTNGLAIALEDVGNGNSWDNSDKNNGGKTAAELCDAWNTSKAVTGGTWRLPSIIDWQNIIIGCGTSGTAVVDPRNTYMKYDGLTSYLSAAGGVTLTSWYWSSTEVNINNAMDLNFTGGTDGALFSHSSKTGQCTVRACLAF